MEFHTRCEAETEALGARLAAVQNDVLYRR